jgi:hypothetical protein
MNVFHKISHIIYNAKSPSFFIFNKKNELCRKFTFELRAGILSACLVRLLRPAENLVDLIFSNKERNGWSVINESMEMT